MALLFLLSAGARQSDFGQSYCPPRQGGASGPMGGRIGLLLFFTAMMVLLASKLLLVLLLVIFAVYLWRARRAMPGWQSLGLAVGLFLGTVLLAATNNPVVGRYKDILLKERTADRGPVVHLFNGLSLRIFIWKAADEIVDERRAWVFGVSAGDSQDLLDEKYYQVGMNEGFLGYNFHNEYIETLVSGGIFGFCVFVGAMVLLCRSVGRRAGLEGWLVLAVILLLACTESSLEMQQPAFLSCFFPLLGWKKVEE